MRKYLTFKSVGGGAEIFNSPGEYVLSIDDLGGRAQVGVSSVKILLPNPWTGTESTVLAFTVTGTNGGDLLYEAIMNQIAAAPGGNFELIIPEGVAITSFTTQNYIV